MKEFANHRLFDKSGRRLGIFGRVVLNELEIFVLTCSKHDRFNRKFVRKVWEFYLEDKPLAFLDMTFKPSIYRIPLLDSEFPKNCFLQHTNDFYCKQYDIYEVVRHKYLNNIDADKLLTEQNNDL